MEQSGASSSKPLSLNELVALNEEIGALVRAGLPLPDGLRAMSADSSRVLRAVSEQLAIRLDKGESLGQALGQMQDSLPAIYSAVVESGQRAGRLPEALECLTRMAKAAQDIRRQLIIASIVPLSVLVLGYAMFMVFLVGLVPELLLTYAALEIPSSWWINSLAYLSETVHIWGGIPPVLCAAFWLFSAIFRKSRSHVGAGSLNNASIELGVLSWFPGVRFILQTWNLANFAELWSLLVTHNVVLTEALYLSSRATGDRGIIRQVDPLIDQLHAGKTLPECLVASRSLPRIFYWVATSEEAELSATLKRISNLLSRRARVRADLFKVLAPVALTIFVAGGVTLCYGLTLFYTMRDMYEGLAVL